VRFGSTRYRYMHVYRYTYLYIYTYAEEDVCVEGALVGLWKKKPQDEIHIQMHVYRYTFARGPVKKDVSGSGINPRPTSEFGLTRPI